MKLKSGDMLLMEAGNNELRIQLIGRDDVPRVEREGRGWRDGATVMLKGADAAEFLDTIRQLSGEYVVGDRGLYVKVEYVDIPGSSLERPVLVLSAGDVSARLTWPERTLLIHAVRNLAWKMFM